MGEIILCDTNIIIDFYKNKDRIVSEVRIIKERNVAISVVTAGELVYGAINKVELSRILKDINGLGLLAINEDVGVLHLNLLTKYSLSHNLTLPDALIAATAIHYGTPLFTLNRKDFHYIDGLSLYAPSWEK